MSAGRLDDAVPLLTNALARVPHHFESRKLPAYALAENGRIEAAARILIGEGPPFGWYLAEYTLDIMQVLEKNGKTKEACRLGQNVLDTARRFPGRARLEAHVRSL